MKSAFSLAVSNTAEVAPPKLSRRFILVLSAYLWLAAVHVVLRAGGFRRLHEFVKDFKLGERPNREQVDVAMLLVAFDVAKRYYVMEIKCLHVAAATTVFLRSFGFSANMVLGVSPHPFFGHTWVEIDGAVVAGTVAKNQYVILDVV